MTGDSTPQQITAEHRKIIWNTTTQAVYTGAKVGANRVTDANVNGGVSNGSVVARTYDGDNGATIYTSINTHKPS